MLIGYTLTYVYPERYYLRQQDAVAIVFVYYRDSGSPEQKLTFKVGLN